MGVDGSLTKTRRTCDADAINVLGRNSLPLNDSVKLGSPAVQDDGVESNTIQETNADGQFIQLVEDGTSDFDDGEFGGLRRIGRRGEDAQMAFDLALGPNGVQKPGDCLLQDFKTNGQHRPG